MTPQQTHHDQPVSTEQPTVVVLEVHPEAPLSFPLSAHLHVRNTCARLNECRVEVEVESSDDGDAWETVTEKLVVNVNTERDIALRKFTRITCTLVATHTGAKVQTFAGLSVFVDGGNNAYFSWEAAE